MAMIEKMVEFKDANRCREVPATLCNSGLMARSRKGFVRSCLSRVSNDNAQGEYYLPDIVNIAKDDGRICAVVVTDDPFEVGGINSRAELADAEMRSGKIAAARTGDGRWRNSAIARDGLFSAGTRSLAAM